MGLGETGSSARRMKSGPQACPCHGHAVRSSMLCWSRQRDWPEHSTLDTRLRAGARELAVTLSLCHTLLPFTIRRTSVVTVNPPWHKSFVLVSRPLVYLNALNLANHKSDAHISKISLNKSKYFKLRLTKIVNNTTEHLNLRHSEFVLNRQTHILSYTLSSCPGLKTKPCRCVAKPISSKLINFLKSP